MPAAKKAAAKQPAAKKGAAERPATPRKRASKKAAPPAAEKAAGEPAEAPSADGEFGGAAASRHTLYLTDETWARARNAFYHGSRADMTVPQSLSSFCDAAIQLYCQVIEEQLNDGKPFPAAPDRLPKGPSLAGAARQSAIMKRLWAQRRGPS